MANATASKLRLACWFALLAALCFISFCESSDSPTTPTSRDTFKKLYRQSARLADAAPLPFVSASLGSNMVLQQAPQAAVLWGWTASPSAKVVASFNQMNYSAVSDDVDGFWELSLPPTPASFQVYSIELQSSAGDQATLSNVLFGDVYLCGGQSNMQFTVSEAFNASVEIQRANDYPNIRLITVGQNNYSQTSLPNLASIEQGWIPASNTSVGGSDWTYFSAVCWFFVRDVFESQQIPIGAVSSNWGGTLIQAWSSNDAISACRSGVPASIPAPNRDNLLWNAMIVPFLPMRMRGAVWYQGEANAGQAAVYECAFPAMISDWRVKFDYTPEEFPFLFVQLAAYIEGTNGLGFGLPDTRLAQAAALSLPYVGMATAIDLGDLLSPQGDIHPRDKQDVGMRLVLNAQQLVYGNDTVVAVGPTPLNNEFQIDQLGETIAVSVSFVAPNGIFLKNNTCPAALLPANCSSFEVGTSDGVWHAPASISQTASNTVQITISNLNSTLLIPTGLRYAYSNWPLAIVYNAEGLPATPFYLETQI